MCGRYVTPEIAAIERYWHIGRHNWQDFILPAFNIAPTTRVPIIIRTDDGTLEGHRARWGFIPHWWKRPELPTMSFNARSEEAHEKPMWRDALLSRRCLMPVRGWYEWRAVEGVKVKQPYFVHVPAEDVLAFAGLWSRTPTSDGGMDYSCALLSGMAAPAIAHIHHRMPLVLHPDHFEEWLHPGTSPARIQELIASARADFEGYPVSTRVNSARNNSPELIQRLQAAS